MHSKEFLLRILKNLAQDDKINSKLREGLNLLIPSDFESNVDGRLPRFLVDSLPARFATQKGHCLKSFYIEFRTEVIGNQALIRFDYNATAETLIVNTSMDSSTASYSATGVFLLKLNQLHTQWVHKFDEYMDHGELVLLTTAT